MPSTLSIFDSRDDESTIAEQLQGIVDDCRREFAAENQWVRVLSRVQFRCYYCYLDLDPITVPARDELGQRVRWSSVETWLEGGRLVHVLEPEVR